MGRPRRKSSLGNDLRGDTGVPAVTTTPLSSKARRQSRERQTILSSKGSGPSLQNTYFRWRELSFRYTWLNPLLVTIAVLVLYGINPTAENPLHAAIFLSYPLPAKFGSAPDAPVQYGKGRKDFAFVAFYTVVLSFTREFIMQQILRPMAIRYRILSKGKQARFMEQAYSAIYFGFLGPLGLYVMYRSPLWYFNTTAMFENFPHKTHEALFKFYYLFQAAYWCQQAIVLVLQLEKPRKDFKELVAHHVITLSLIWCSYRFHFTYIGLPVYITHDISDLFLASSKVLNYLDSPIITPYFCLFMASWVYLRHYINLKILYAVLTEFRTVGPFELNWDTQQYKCWISQYITFGLLASLQAVNLFWLYLILKILKKIILEKVTEDVRSDDEGDDDEDESSSSNSEEERRNSRSMTNGHHYESLTKEEKVKETKKEL